MATATVERTLYGKTLEPETAGVESFPLEQFRPLPGTVLVERFPARSVSEGGIILPEDAQEPPPMARVMAVPDDPKCVVRIGDIVFVRKYSTTGNPLPLGGNPLLALVNYTDGPESDIHGYIRDEGK